MSSYKLINGVWRGVSEAAFPNVKYVIATRDNVAKVQLKKGQVLIAIFDGYQLRRTNNKDSTEQTQNFFFMVGLQDTYQSSSVEQENAVATADILADQMLDDLEAIGEDLAFDFTDIIKTPVYKQGGDTVSGMTVQMNISITRCQDNIFPNLQEYIGQIGRKIDPYDWQGITKRS